MLGEAPGARWIRAALQVNPYAYKGKYQPSTSFRSETEYNKALLDECEALGVKLIAVTDHWSVDTAVGLIAEAGARGIVALPGFEANTSEGVHLLVVFEADTDVSTVNAAIGACGVEPGCPNGTTGRAFKDVLDMMSDRGALVIPAHANGNGGLLTGRAGQPLVAMVTDPNLHAIAITPTQPQGVDQGKITAGTRPYERKHPIAVVYADDVVHPEQLKAVGATSWFKVSTSKAENLRLAVRTPETRVALEDPVGKPRTLLRQISWTGGFLDGVTIPISSDLTTLIGGRGTGKSTVIESLRYVLNLAPSGQQAKVDHKAIVDKVLRSGTIVRLDVDTVSPTPRSFTIERVVPDPPVVLDASGTATSLHPSDVAGLVEVFGQHELAELANDPTSVAAMLQRFTGAVSGDGARGDLLASLATNREEIRTAEEARASLAEELSDIPRLEEQVQQFRKTDVATRLADLQRLAKDEAVFDEAKQRVNAAREALSALTGPELEASLTADYEGLADSPHQHRLQPAAMATSTLASTLKSALADAEEAVAEAEARIAAARAEWDGAVKEQREKHAEVLRQLHEDGLEPDKYLTTTQALDALKAKEPRLVGFSSTLEKLHTQRGELLGALAEHERNELEALHAAVRAANEATEGVVVVRPIASPDRQRIIDVVSAQVPGQRTQIVAAVNSDGFSPRGLATAIRNGVDGLAELGIRGAQATNLVAAGEPLARELEELSVGHAVEVLLDVSAGGSRELRTMDELSKGQRATALLLLLLGASTAPLVIDQPEDDLDNRFIYDGVVRHLRGLKGVRQIIASTHNANVPVLGDAELIIALEGDGRHGRPAADGVGSLDDATIRAMAENLLEGGPAAFNARQHLYGF